MNVSTNGVVSRRRVLILANLCAVLVLGYLTLWRFAPTGSADDIARAIAEHHVHGPRDDLLTPEEMSRNAMTGRVMATCGPTSVWAADLFRNAGYEARVVTTLTLEEWNSADNGHTLVSVREASGWVVYDVDRHVRYTDLDGNPLNIAQLVERVPTDAYRIVPLGPQQFGEGYIRETNHRLLQVAGISDGDRYVFPDVSERIGTYAANYDTLPMDEWLARFY